MTFSLIVDNFCVQYVDKDHADHLLTALQERYTVTTYWTGTKFAGIDIVWYYTQLTARHSMAGYIKDILIKYRHPLPLKPQHTPHAHLPVTYGATTQLVPNTPNDPLLTPAETKCIQGIVGSLLYYAPTVDN